MNLNFEVVDFYLFMVAKSQNTMKLCGGANDKSTCTTDK